VHVAHWITRRRTQCACN